ncbi:MAG: AAA family ATPase [Pirellulaceae bacterium]
MEQDIARVRRGLVLGKFLPPHAGHEFLVRFASGFADQLTVLVCSLPRDPIPGELRYAWTRELFPHVRIVHVADELPQEPAEHPRFWPIWRDVVCRAAGGPLDYIFASETYGIRLAEEVGARFIPADLARGQVPVSGTRIRQQPLKYWDYLPPCVRPHFVRRVCLVGPESTGKSVLAARLAAHFRTRYVAEFARELLNLKHGVCDPADISDIARGQQAAEDALARQANRILICDTDALLTTVWSEMLFGSCPAEVRDLAASRSYDLYLLLDVDVPWVDDGQRFLAARRPEFFARCRQRLEELRRPYQIVGGDWEQRFVLARDAIACVLREPEP